MSSQEATARHWRSRPARPPLEAAPTRIPQTCRCKAVHPASGQLVAALGIRIIQLSTGVREGSWRGKQDVMDRLCANRRRLFAARDRTRPSRLGSQRRTRTLETRRVHHTVTLATNICSGIKAYTWKNPNRTSQMQAKSFARRYPMGNRLSRTGVSWESSVPACLPRSAGQKRGQAKVIQDFCPLLVPSAQTRALHGAAHLKCLIESVNEVWHDSISRTRTRPQPNYGSGFRHETFTQDQLDNIKTALGD